MSQLATVRANRAKTGKRLFLALWNFKHKDLKYQWNFRPHATVISKGEIPNNVHTQLYCFTCFPTSKLGAGTPPIKQFSYNSVFYLTLFFQVKNCSKIPFNVFFWKTKQKSFQFFCQIFFHLLVYINCFLYNMFITAANLLNLSWMITDF